MTSDTFRRARRLGAALLLVTAACGDDGGSPEEVRPSEDLNFVRALADAPPLQTTVLAFWAKKGRAEERVIFYVPRPGLSDAEEFLRFRLEDRSLAFRPDGSAIAEGDSVLITVTVIDPTRLVVNFQPSGLRFTPGREARLKFSLAETDDDRDDDGDVDVQDQVITTQLAIWRQELEGQPWVKLTSTVFLETDEIEARLTGFTNYAIAW